MQTCDVFRCFIYAKSEAESGRKWKDSLHDLVPAHRALRLAVNIREDLDIPPSWRQPHERPQDTRSMAQERLDGSIMDQWNRAVSHGTVFWRNVFRQISDNDDVKAAN